MKSLKSSYAGNAATKLSPCAESTSEAIKHIPVVVTYVAVEKGMGYKEE